MKQELRRLVIARRNALAETVRETKSEIIYNKLTGLPAWQQAEVVMSYVSFGSEVTTHALIKGALAVGKRVAVPLCVREGRCLIPSEIFAFPDDLRPGTWGILEPRQECLRPLDPQLIDLVIVPGVAFDRKGNRLGYGAGYYDRFLKTLRPGAAIIALAFSEQIVPDVYAEDHDLPVDMVVTDEEVINCCGYYRRREQGNA
ncbi:5-formyltetrahydrofolate cyclo-ligase [Neomoorella humiferrea]|uniref:5-formyltetrahydrofolate cyclo-ligase n=1 Tax=Neomoorella humiferrea TaxID=676965 RepID=A0A2T0AJX2_9FIRM|nr:5-formyltetrahydrofolate cyclo-ligase [Moorella humiferrea]PRR68698.1 putative 5-formyltetrahydrofolate cyclo-ligase [Moorella humiferrea]